jgi:hypothetical protein
VSFDNLAMMGARDRAGLQHHDRLFDLSSASRAPKTGREFGQVLAEAAGLDGNQALATRDSDTFFGPDGFGFDDFLDLVNPLQHIPIVSTIYREITGDEISPGARLFGGALFGGPVGFASSLANVVVEEVAGKDIGELALGLVGIGDDGSELASAEPAPAPVGNDSEAEILGRLAPAAGAAPEAKAGDDRAALPEQDRFAGILAPRNDAPDYLDRMSDEQRALLLSSLGIAPEDAERPAQAMQAAQTTQGDKVAEAADAAQSPVPAANTDRIVAPDKPAETPFRRVSADATTSPFKNGLKDSQWSEITVPPGVDPTSPDWVANAMMRALDKYESTFNASQARGGKLNSDI